MRKIRRGHRRNSNPCLNSKPQNRAQTKEEARPQGQVKKPAGDRAKTAEINPEAGGGKACHGRPKQG